MQGIARQFLLNIFESQRLRHHLAGRSVWEDAILIASSQMGRERLQVAIVFIAMVWIDRIGDSRHMFRLAHVVFPASTSPHEDVVRQVPGDLMTFSGWRGER